MVERAVLAGADDEVTAGLGGLVVVVVVVVVGEVVVVALGRIAKVVV